MNLEKVFWVHFHNYVRRLRFQISPDGETSVRDLIAHGVSEMTRLQYSPAQLDGAKSKLRFFADEMIVLANHQHTRILTGNIVHKIKEKICPLHPFC